jgi:hypothetical protein
MTRRFAFALALIALAVAGCRAGPGEACAEDADCQQKLSCFEDLCRPRAEIASIEMQRREEAWKEQKREIFDKAGALQEKMADIERQLAETADEGERKRLRQELERLRKAGETKGE